MYAKQLITTGGTAGPASMVAKEATGIDELDEVLERIDNTCGQIEMMAARIYETVCDPAPGAECPPDMSTATGGELGIRLRRLKAYQQRLQAAADTLMGSANLLKR